MSNFGMDDARWIILPSDKVKFIEKLKLSKNDIQKVQQLEQRGDNWHNFRKSRLTASLFGAAAGHSPYDTTASLLKKMLYPVSFTNEAIRHGIRCESTAFEDAQLLFHREFTKQGAKSVALNEIGLVIDEERPYLGGSADGILTVIWDYRGDIKIRQSNIEIKCPRVFYTDTPHYYYDQFQGVAGILKMKACEFIVWSKEKIQIKFYDFNQSYWKNELLPKLDEFYIDQFIPNAIFKERGLLDEENKQVIVQRPIF